MCPKCNVHTAHIGSFVIAIDGACSNNGNDRARSAIGVFHGYDSEWNSSYTLDGLDRHTSQIAQLAACSRALSDALVIQEGLKMPGDRLDAVVIKSDSEYVVRGVTEWLPKWKKNGWKNAKGQSVANYTYFQEIKRLIELLEEDSSVKFWIVPREQNKMADSLAVSALGGKATKSGQLS
jgi:ribonuclease HI